MKLGLINFTNCLPLNYTLEKWQPENTELVYGNPAQLNKLMAEDKIDAAPVSSIEYIKNRNKYQLIQTASISSDGECGSVILFSNKKFKDIKNIALPHDSVASVAMLKIIMKNHDINFSEHNYNDINPGIDAALFIGDNALKENAAGNRYKFSYDVGNLWKNLTGYPAVFGTWVKRKGNIVQPDNLIPKAIETGLGLYFNEILNFASNNLQLPKQTIEDYLTRKINYNFTERHKQSLEKFEEIYTSCFNCCNYPGYTRI